MNTTAKRLRNMRTGDSIVFYRGNLAADIEHSRDVPQYREILEMVSATARELEREGKIVLSEQPGEVTVERTLKDGTKVARRFPIILYTAVKP